MGCSAKLYISRAHDIPVTISDESDITTAEIDDLTITLTLKSDASKNASFTKSGGGIIFSGSNITLLIAATDITVAGNYDVKIDLLDTGGKLRGITPCPGVLRFYN